MPELLQRPVKETVSFPGLLQRESKVETPRTPKKPEHSESEIPKTDSESIPKKPRGRPRKDAVVGEAPRKKGIDPKNAKVL